MAVVLIDDLRCFKTPVEHALYRTLDEGLEWLAATPEETVVEQLWLDHDLGLAGERITDIIPFVKALEERALAGTAPDIRMILVHTSNSRGGRDIMAGLERHFRTVRVVASDYLFVPAAD